MKLSKITAAVAAIVLGAASAASMAAGSSAKGEIRFTGEINESPCTITSDTQFQTLAMDSISSSVLKNGGKSALKKFVIKLQGCDNSALKAVTATFTGAESSNDGLLKLGGVEGASLAIADDGGSLIKLGAASSVFNLSAGDNNLRFSAYLQGDTALGGESGTEVIAADIVGGTFDATAGFTLAYQ
ncbi:fimbrial protein [Pseudomonas sp. Au-Pse12]|uniref:fimbrial protein n=1 Tax=Pseudomonas sp. Au-Pse12 TaxID=2906459 RepID=UPI001E621347|nr:fimbrial protein [Pseudomonas sp. Au-Pse12]MCE4056746.1 type 1 fimbrial protein [Pseudomonas sp. Au-Pse12]